jgi:hypothetical protein
MTRLNRLPESGCLEDLCRLNLDPWMGISRSFESIHRVSDKHLNTEDWNSLIEEENVRLETISGRLLNGNFIKREIRKT